MAENLVVVRSENFAVRIVNLYKILSKQRQENIMSKQLLRSGTSIGANIAEAQEAQSDNDFIAKLYIALKETGETNFWLKILYRSEYLTESEFNSIYSDSNDLRSILTAIIKTKKINIKSVKG